MLYHTCEHRISQGDWLPSKWIASPNVPGFNFGSLSKPIRKERSKRFMSVYPKGVGELSGPCLAAVTIYRPL